MTTIPQTKNTRWGFYGTIKNIVNNDKETADKIWDAMFTRIDNMRQRTADDIVKFLDSRIGRHLADDIGVNIGKRSPIKILRMIESMPMEYMDKWWSYYYRCA